MVKESLVDLTHLNGEGVVNGLHILMVKESLMDSTLLNGRVGVVETHHLWIVTLGLVDMSTWVNTS